jgi:hypothetical protein
MPAVQTNAGGSSRGRLPEIEVAGSDKERASASRINVHALRRWMTSGPDDFPKTPSGT